MENKKQEIYYEFHACPFCGSSDRSFLPPDVIPGIEIRLEASCNRCSGEWTEIYKYSDVLITT